MQVSEGGGRARPCSYCSPSAAVLCCTPANEILCFRSNSTNLSVRVCVLITKRMTPASSFHGDFRHDPGPAKEDLRFPPPTTMPLQAALLLLENPLYTKTVFNKVFLLSKDYLVNWLTWAYHQPVAPEEIRRVQLAIRMAAENASLPVPKLNDPYKDPGPIDSTCLSCDGLPLVLRDNVVLWDGTQNEGVDLVLACAVPEGFYEVRMFNPDET